MSTVERTFGALVAHDSVSLVEYASERTGVRVVNQWTDTGRSSTLDEALRRVVAMIVALDVTRATLALAIEQFGMFHHLMTLPTAPDAVLRPIVRREVQRVFGLTDPVVAYSRTVVPARQTPARAAAPTGAAQTRLSIAGATKDTVNTLSAGLAARGIRVDVATVVPKAIHSLYDASGGAYEPTAVLVCLDGGPHLSFFLDGQLELAIDPPIALEGERPSVSALVDQVERGAVYFRQQFRGAVATRLLLATRPEDYEGLARALEARLGVRVKPLFAGASSPEATIAMGAVLEGRLASPLDLFPHPPSVADRVATAVRGPNAIVAAGAFAAVLAGIWAASQFATLASVRNQSTAARASLQRALPAVAPLRQIAERRADFARQADFVQQSDAERLALTATLQAIAQAAPAEVAFDSLLVSRSSDGWSVAIEGEIPGQTSTQAVRDLEMLYTAVRDRHGVTSVNLERFDYPSAPDSSHAATSVTSSAAALLFRLSFVASRVPERLAGGLSR